MHEDEVSIDVPTVRALLDDQFPRWRGAPVTRVSGDGTVNAIFRVGQGHAARFPLCRMDLDAARAWLGAEAAAQAELVLACPFPTPNPVALGRPGNGYPMPFAIQTWVDGLVPGVGEAADSVALAEDLARLVERLRATPTGGRVFSGSGRGGALSDHDDWVATCVERNAPWFDPRQTGRFWAGVRDLPAAGQDVMTHGDLIPGNVLVRAGRLVGVLDGGGFGPADPGLELVCAWHLLDGPRREVLRAALGCHDLEWERGRAWAFAQAMGLVHYYALSNPAMCALGVRTLQQVLAR